LKRSIDNMNFNVFIGIDQTGAATKSGQPKMLPVAIIYKKKHFVNLNIQSITESEIEKILIDQLNLSKLKIKNLKPLILVDSVLGLPADLKVELKSIFKEIEFYQYNEKKYGAQTAYSFFNKFISKNMSTKPRRHVEVLAKANSVFNLTPYQRNIGCGSYRILKDLSQNQKWFQIWPHYLKSSKWATIAEGYPTYYWKTLFNFNSRPNKNHLNINFKTADHADAYILAFAAYTLRNAYNKISLPHVSQTEGWIYGFNKFKSN